MPLWSGSAKVVDRAGVISIQMRDHERVVRVDIRHEVLIGGSQLGSHAAVPAFEKNRELIERLASKRGERILDDRSSLLDDMREDAPATSANSRTPAAVE